MKLHTWPGEVVASVDSLSLELHAVCFVDAAPETSKIMSITSNIVKAASLGGIEPIYPISKS